MVCSIAFYLRTPAMAALQHRLSGARLCAPQTHRSSHPPRAIGCSRRRRLDQDHDLRWIAHQQSSGAVPMEGGAPGSEPSSSGQPTMMGKSMVIGLAGWWIAPLDGLAMIACCVHCFFAATVDILEATVSKAPPLAFLNKFHTPRWLFRTVACLVLGGQVFARMAKGVCWAHDAPCGAMPAAHGCMPSPPLA